MITSDALSRPETIETNPNIFQKIIKETNNNQNTTCLDLALKKLSLNTYIIDLGKYNIMNFQNIYNPEKKTDYTYTYIKTIIVNYILSVILNI